jgi:DNA-directed RNA polymerase specialized sigma24 family protein
MPARPRLQLVPAPDGALASRSDDELMVLVQAGMRDAFAVLVERHARRLAAACSRLVGDSQVGLELAQETWLTAWDRRASYRGEGRFVVWMYALARNRCRNHLRIGRLLFLESPVEHLLTVWNRDASRLQLQAAVAPLPGGLALSVSGRF